MKRKSRVVFTVGLIFVLAAGSVCAAVYNGGYTVDAYDLNQIVKIPDIENTDKLRLVADKIENTVPNEETAYMQILNYVYAIEKYAATDEEQNYLHDLILNGADADMVRRIYAFLQDTDYSVDMVEEMYNIALDIYEDDEFWVETAFNKATGNIHGVLDKEQVTAYIEQGLTAEDITAANVLCRKGVYTIREILDMRADGTQWSDIFDEVYSDITEPKTLFGVRSFKKVCKNGKEQKPEDMFTAVWLSKMANQGPEQFLTYGEYGIDDYKSKITSDYIDRAEEILSGIDVNRPKQKIEQAGKEILDIAREKGVSEELINQYFAEGFSDIDIKNAVSVAEDIGESVETVMEKYGNDMSITEIISEGGADN